MAAAKLGLDDFSWGPLAEGPCSQLTGEHLLSQHLLAQPDPTWCGRSEVGRSGLPSVSRLGFQGARLFDVSGAKALPLQLWAE